MQKIVFVLFMLLIKSISVNKFVSANKIKRVVFMDCLKSVLEVVINKPHSNNSIVTEIKNNSGKNNKKSKYLK